LTVADLKMYIMNSRSYVMESVLMTARMGVKKVTVTYLRGQLKHYMKVARANQVVLVENRRQPSKYLVDKDFLDSLVKERESVMATLEVLADRELTDRLLGLSKTIDKAVAAGRLLTTADVFGQ
jgi:PHD/YefM family antitoxin component YafN of YafNO toxin-antitoxin module